MRQGGYWVVYKITSGRTVERLKSWRRGTPAGPRRRRVKGSATLRKMEANLRAAVKHLARVLNCNFQAGDMHLTLKYDDAHLPADWKAQEQDAAAFIRRLKKALQRQGATVVRWVSVCSDKDGDTGDQVRPHIHLVVTGRGISWTDGAWRIGEKSLTDIWGNGSVYGEPLRDQADYTALAIYLLRQAGNQPDRKKYHVARNMEKPIIEESIARTGRELTAPRNSRVVERAYDATSGTNYVRYTLPAAEEEAAGGTGGGKPSGGGKGGGGHGLS